MRKPIIAGNWKMHKTIAEALEFVNEVKDKVNNDKSGSCNMCTFYIIKRFKRSN